MLDFNYAIKNGQLVIETSLKGKPLLTTPQLNKSTAFTAEEREMFGLTGKLPACIETLDQQVRRAYCQFQSFEGNLDRNIYLGNLHDTNQVLFYRLVSDHLAEMLPVIYTPIVGTAVKQFSHEFRQPRGLYITYSDMDKIEEILINRSNPEIDLIVVTDGEGVLGIGDQGIGGMDIPVAKLMVYALCGGINPVRTLPILLDVGTNNQTLLDDPLYLGWRHERVRGKEYDDFIDTFVEAVKKQFPKVFLHWEDFSRENARRNLDRFRGRICTFNDDMQGTGVVTVSAILAAIKASGAKIEDQKVVVFGAGTAGTGIADGICEAMVTMGIPKDEALKKFWLLDRPGLLTCDTPDLNEAQRCYARDAKENIQWIRSDANMTNLLDVVTNVHPTILIGCSAVGDAFNQEIICTMAKYTAHPIILPLSNPTERSEAKPADIFAWTNGKAFIATGSPFDPIKHNGEEIHVAQCNNALVFPGIGLGIIASAAQRLTEKMLWRACETLANCSPILQDPKAPILPGIEFSRDVARKIAVAVAEQASADGVAQNILRDYGSEVDSHMWSAEYIPLQYRPHP